MGSWPPAFKKDHRKKNRKKKKKGRRTHCHRGGSQPSSAALCLSSAGPQTPGCNQIPGFPGSFAQHLALRSQFSPAVALLPNSATLSSPKPPLRAPASPAPNVCIGIWHCLIVPGPLHRQIHRTDCGLPVQVCILSLRRNVRH